MNKEFYVTDDLLATHGQRFANFFLDIIFRLVLLFVIILILGFIAGFTGNYGLINWTQSMNGLEEYLLDVLFVIIYYVCTELFLSRSLGKFITKTIIVMEDGSKPTKDILIKRTLCRLIPLNHFSFLSSPCRGWHDSISDTYVVKKDVFEEQMRLFYAFEEIGKEIAE